MRARTMKRHCGASIANRRRRPFAFASGTAEDSETGLFMRLNKTFLNGDLPGCRKRLWTQMVVEALLEPFMPALDRRP
jgi:hypothetical protein